MVVCHNFDDAKEDRAPKAHGIFASIQVQLRKDLVRIPHQLWGEAQRQHWQLELLQKVQLDLFLAPRKHADVFQRENNRKVKSNPFR